MENGLSYQHQTLQSMTVARLKLTIESKVNVKGQSQDAIIKRAAAAAVYPP